MNIISFVPTGRENAVSRYDIAKAVGISERDVRFKIKEANKELEQTGEAIVSSSSGRGYWRTSNIAEMEKYLQESSRRRATQAKNDLPIQRIVSRAKGEALIYVKGHFRRIRVNPAQTKL